MACCSLQTMSCPSKAGWHKAETTTPRANETPELLSLRISTPCTSLLLIASACTRTSAPIIVPSQKFAKPRYLRPSRLANARPGDMHDGCASNISTQAIIMHTSLRQNFTAHTKPQAELTLDARTWPTDHPPFATPLRRLPRDVSALAAPLLSCSTCSSIACGHQRNRDEHRQGSCGGYKQGHHIALPCHDQQHWLLLQLRGASTAAAATSSLQVATGAWPLCNIKEQRTLSPMSSPVSASSTCCCPISRTAASLSLCAAAAAVSGASSAAGGGGRGLACTSSSPSSGSLCCPSSDGSTSASAC